MLLNFFYLYVDSQDFFGEKHKGEVILYVHYLICMLLPLLKQINRDQNDELEIEARIKGRVVIPLVSLLGIKF